ncbi:MAG: ComF family protein [Bacteroidota bacterium]
MQLFHQFINLLFPQTCNACSEVLLKSEKILCTTCLLHLPKANIGFSNSQNLENRFIGKVEIKGAYSFLKYSKGGKVQNLLHNLKYKNRQEAGIFLGKLFGNQLINDGNLPKIDLLIAIPLHERKLLTRGFNQSDLIADGLSEVLNVPHETKAISRQKATETQTNKSRIDRFFNVENVFQIENKEIIKDKSIGLVDDVLTTGATMEVCATTLLKGGAKEVTILSLAAAI